jgi:arginyl-tRNA synthetase
VLLSIATMSIKHRIVELSIQAINKAQRDGSLPPGPTPDIEVAHTQNPQHGDYAISLPLRLARSARMHPMAIADQLVQLITSSEEFGQVWSAPPGFINFAMKDAWLQKQIGVILECEETYGNIKSSIAQKIQVEFVSVNPTGPIHVGHARGAVLGSGLANILAAAGHEVHREYYINNFGSQMNLFFRSLYARYLQTLGRKADIPENGYMGSYLKDLADEIVGEEGERFLEVSENDAISAIGNIGLQKILSGIQISLEKIGVEFDTWFSEKSLYESGEYETAIAILRDGGYLAQRDDAIWFTSTDLGDEKDNVIVRSTGEPTYFASDIAYHHNKFLERRFDKVINIWGADHQGHISRLKAAVTALDVDPNRLTILISQLVTLKRDKERVRVSKRTGDLIELNDLVEEVGPDACRFFFLSRSPQSQMDFDLELAKQESSDNPVYYIQYAYARISSIMRLANSRDLNYREGNVKLLTHQAEISLIKKMIALPELIEMISETLEPHHLPRYATELATAFHWFYKECRVVSEKSGDAAITLSRLKLVEACRIVLARCLSLMGMTTPEQM